MPNTLHSNTYLTNPSLSPVDLNQQAWALLQHSAFETLTSHGEHGWSVHLSSRSMRPNQPDGTPSVPLQTHITISAPTLVAVLSNSLRQLSLLSVQEAASPPAFNVYGVLSAPAFTSIYCQRYIAPPRNAVPVPQPNGGSGGYIEPPATMWYAQLGLLGVTHMVSCDSLTDVVSEAARYL